MKFRVSCSYYKHGGTVLREYNQLQNYKPEIIDDELYVVIDSLEDLVELKNSIKQSIILDWDSSKENYLIIYDDYIE